MMYCPRCHTKYSDPTDVCRYCEIPLVEKLPSRTLTDYMEDAAWRDDEEYNFASPGEDDEEAQDLLDIRQAAEDQKMRVKLLNRHLILRLMWFGAWLAAGFFTAYFMTPDDAGEEMRLLIQAAFISAALILANLVLKIRAGRDLPDMDDTNP